MTKVIDISAKRKSKPETLEEKAKRILAQYSHDMEGEPQYSGDPKNLKEACDVESE